ncbi:MAG TPA: protease pro-enzyme activation domain-containing protein, partial [Gammaproteobacteria bacterium]|nr:protease pro-enzyme activation domain-containing protein [Gammaproteobacteria bacterium]
MRTLRKQALAFALASSLIAPAVLAGTAFPTRETPQSVDLGHMASAAGANITLTVALKLRNTDEMMNLMQGLYAKGSPQYHRFLTTDQFRSRFAPSAATVDRVSQQFQSQGLTVTRIGSSLLSVSGSQAAIEQAFSISLHSYSVAAHGDTA